MPQSFPGPPSYLLWFLCLFITSTRPSVVCKLSRLRDVDKYGVEYRRSLCLLNWTWSGSYQRIVGKIREWFRTPRGTTMKTCWSYWIGGENWRLGGLLEWGLCDGLKMAKFAQLMGQFRYEDHGGELTSLPARPLGTSAKRKEIARKWQKELGLLLRTLLWEYRYREKSWIYSETFFYREVWFQLTHYCR